MYTKAKAAYLYAFGIGGCIFGATYLLPPFYSTFCEKSGFGGADAVRAEYETVHDPSKLHRKFTISFESMVEPELKWSFWPLQETVEMNSGDTVLAFFRAYNDEPNPIIGISSYVIIPDQAIDYFHKIQCFCFDEQMLNSKEEVDLPLFFYLDPKICDDPKCNNVNEITLKYTFYKSMDQSLAEKVDEL